MRIKPDPTTVSAAPVFLSLGAEYRDHHTLWATSLPPGPLYEAWPGLSSLQFHELWEQSTQNQGLTSVFPTGTKLVCLPTHLSEMSHKHRLRTQSLEYERASGSRQ